VWVGVFRGDFRRRKRRKIAIALMRRRSPRATPTAMPILVELEDEEVVDWEEDGELVVELSGAMMGTMFLPRLSGNMACEMEKCPRS